MKLKLLLFTILIISLIAVSSGCITGKQSYSETVTQTILDTATSYSTVEMVTVTTKTDTISITTTVTIINTTSTSYSTIITTTTTTFLNNVTYITYTTIVTFRYGNDGKPNIVYYTPLSDINSLSIVVDISKTTVYYPSSYSNLYTPILPLFRFYDKKYYSSLMSQLGISTWPEDPTQAALFVNTLRKKIVLTNTMTYPTFIDAAISSSILNPIEFANYMVGVAVINSQTPTLILISNRTTSTMGVIIDGKPIIGTRIFGNTFAMMEYYYNKYSGHIEYLGVVNPNYPTMTITQTPITSGLPLIGLMMSNITYTLTATISFNGTESIFTQTGVFGGDWGTFIETNAIGNTITGFVSNSTIYLITNTFTTNTLPANLANITSVFLPAPIREEYIYSLDTVTVVVSPVDPVAGIWFIATVSDGNITGQYINSSGAQIGYYTGTISVQ